MSGGLADEVWLGFIAALTLLLVTSLLVVIRQPPWIPPPPAEEAGGQHGAPEPVERWPGYPAPSYGRHSAGPAAGARGTGPPLGPALGPPLGPRWAHSGPPLGPAVGSTSGLLLGRLPGPLPDPLPGPLLGRGRRRCRSGSRASPAGRIRCPGAWLGPGARLSRRAWLGRTAGRRESPAARRGARRPGRLARYRSPGAWSETPLGAVFEDHPDGVQRGLLAGVQPPAGSGQLAVQQRPEMAEEPGDVLA